MALQAGLAPISDRFTLLAQYVRDNFRRRAPVRDGSGAQDRKIRAEATHGADGRSEYNSTDFAGANGIGAHETRFGARVKRAAGEVKRAQNAAGLADGFHLSVTSNIVLRPDAFDSFREHGAVAHNDGAHRSFTAFAGNFGELQTSAHIRFMQRVSHLFHGRERLADYHRIGRFQHANNPLFARSFNKTQPHLFGTGFALCRSEGEALL